ncbi:MAG TPA: hypothetical protein VGJ18_22935, partial [Gemmatimonadaceae bacterium]
MPTGPVSRRVSCNSAGLLTRGTSAVTGHGPRTGSSPAKCGAPLLPVILLVAHEVLTPTEAAAVCGVTPEALRQRLSRARAALVEKLGETPAVAKL